MNEQLELFEVEPSTQHVSMFAPLPKGWTDEIYDEGKYRRAVDPDGFRWYWQDGRWVLNVPGFCRSLGLPGDADDDIAVCDHKDGERECKITKGGTIILTRSRFVGPQRWDH